MLYKEKKTFNSLFEMRLIVSSPIISTFISLSILYLRCGAFYRTWTPTGNTAIFQFSIWDAILARTYRIAPYMTLFQFSIWDARTLDSYNDLRRYETFNSLFEMQICWEKTGWWSWQRYLSILYLRCTFLNTFIKRSNSFVLSILYLRCWGFLRLVFLGF